MLIYTWPYALFFWLVSLWTFFPELRIIRGRPDPRTPSQDANSKRLIIFGQGIATVAAFVIAGTVPSATISHREAWFWIGVCLSVAGSLLRRHCWRMLGSSFTGDVIVKPNQTVVESGAYRYVRHPSYTAGGLIYLGIGLCLSNWISLLLILGAAVFIYGYRVSVEERTLVSVIGKPYHDYMNRTKRFVPFLF